jgi:pyrroline-5-carboxylate reductase
MFHSDNNLIIGFLGCGKIGAAVATGYATAGKGHKIVVSRRSEEKSSYLALTFPDIVTVCDNNNDIVSQCDIVFIGLLPGVARIELPLLNFSSVKAVVSMMAAVNFAETLNLLPSATAGAVYRIVPLPSASRHVGPILTYPLDPTSSASVSSPSSSSSGNSNADIRTILSQVGTVIPCAAESEMLPMIAVTGHISSFYELMNVTQQWVVGNGVNQAAAELFVASFYSSLSSYALTSVEQSQHESTKAEHSIFPFQGNDDFMLILIYTVLFVVVVVRCIIVFMVHFHICVYRVGGRSSNSWWFKCAVITIPEGYTALLCSQGVVGCHS